MTTSDSASACQRQRVKLTRVLANSCQLPMLKRLRDREPASAAPTSNSVRDTNTAVKTFASRPIASVVANPRIELVPN